MSIFCLGVNHKTAPIEIRERLAFAEKTLPESLREILSIETIDETVILSTCNRVEIYGASTLTSSAMDDLVNFLIAHFDVDGYPVDFYRHEAEAAAHHLFEVVSGLDSMVLGETEIVGQVKKAYQTALESKVTGRRLNKLFQQSFQINKKVRSNSKIQHGSTSIGSVAVDVAEKIFGDLSKSKVMIVGAGEMSRITAQSMVSRGADGIIVSNRNYDKAVELADTLNGRAMRFDDWESALSEVDILISSTAAPQPIIKKDAVERHMKIRRYRPLFLIDIAVPRDIEEGIGGLDNAYLFNIDQLTQIAIEGKNRREEQIVFCRQLIFDHLKEKGIGALKTIPAEGTDHRSFDPNRPITNP